MSLALDNLPPTISVEDAAEILGVSRRSGYRAASRGQIPTVRIGRRILVPSAKLLEMLGRSYRHVEGQQQQSASFPSTSILDQG